MKPTILMLMFGSFGIVAHGQTQPQIFVPKVVVTKTIAPQKTPQLIAENKLFQAFAMPTDDMLCMVPKANTLASMPCAGNTSMVVNNMPVLKFPENVIPKIEKNTSSTLRIYKGNLNGVEPL